MNSSGEDRITLNTHAIVVWKMYVEEEDGRIGNMLWGEGMIRDVHEWSRDMCVYM